MFFSHASLSRLPIVGGLTLGVVLILGATNPATAQPKPGQPKPWPWDASGYQGYIKPHGSPPISPEPVRQSATPRQYTLQVTVLPQKNSEENAALLVAHVPEDAEIWFGDSPTTQKGNIRQFVYKTLTPGKDSTSTI